MANTTPKSKLPGGQKLQVSSLQLHELWLGKVITLAGIAYLIFMSEVYGSIRSPYMRTYAPKVKGFLEASGRQLGPLDESTFKDCLIDWNDV